MKQLLLQAFNLIRQNPFYATISIIGTAVTIAFVMVVVMIYDFRTMDMAPESDRSDMMYTGSGMTYRKLDHTNQNSGMGRKAFEALFSELPSVKEVTWYRGVSKTPCNLSASNEIFNYYVRPVADNWFKFFDYEFIAGRPFTQEEYDARRWVSVITERMALQLFGTTDVVGKEYQSNFFPTKVVGVVKDVNAIFQTAYADAFVPFSLENEDYYATWTGGLGGIRLGLLKLLPDTRPAEVRTEVQHRQDRLNSSTAEYAFEMNELYTHTEYTFFRGKDISAPLVYSMLLMVLLIVPAINISGMTNARMQERVTEIAVREANRLGIPVFAIVDTNSDPSNVDFVIPANDDATKSVEVILDACCGAIAEGLEERKAEKVDMEAAGENAPKGAGKKKNTKARMDKAEEEAINAAKAAAFLKEDEEA